MLAPRSLPDPDWPDPVEVVNEAGASPVVLICEHASNHIPTEYAALGLGAADLRRHIAWDPGAEAVARALSARLDAPLFLGRYSRLLIDLNRPVTAPSAFPVRSEATDIPGNAALTEAERARRIAAIFAPFHARVARHLDGRAAAGRATVILGIHSFTPVFLGVARPWQAGVLYARAQGFGRALVAELARDPSLSVGMNEPYRIERDSDYAIPVHGDDRGLPAALIELRNDLIATPEDAADWAARLARAIPAALAP